MKGPRHAAPARHCRCVRPPASQSFLLPWTENFDASCRGFEDRFGGITHAFFEALSPNEKELFKATTIAELLLEEVKAAEKIHKDKSISRKVSQALKPLVQGVEQYGAALDVISNASSQFLCPVWGSMRVILHVPAAWNRKIERRQTNPGESLHRNLESILAR